MFNIPQTHLQLMLLAKKNGLKQTELESIFKACMLVSESFSGVFRGSAKPFEAHLIGTGAILIEAEEDINVVLAGILHALLDNFCDIPNVGRDAAERLEFVERNFGSDVACLLSEYTQIKWSYAQESWREFSSSPYGVQVLTIRIANELEDLLYGALYVHGTEFDNTDVRKSSAWREKYFEQVVPEFHKVLSEIKKERLERIMVEIIKDVKSFDFLRNFKTGRYGAYYLPKPMLSKYYSFESFRLKYLNAAKRRFSKLIKRGVF